MRHFWIGNLFRAVELKREANRLAQDYPGSRSKSPAISTVLMGAAPLAGIFGLVLARPAIMLGGLGLLLLGVLVAVVEIVLESRR